MPSPTDSSFSLTGRTSRSLSQLRLHRAWTHVLLALGFVQVILGVLIVTFSLVTASITTNTKIKHSCPSWAGFSLAVSGLIGCISWKKPITLVVTAFTLVSALSVMLSLAGSILSCQNGQLVKSFNSCKKDNNWCICCHPISQQEAVPDCREMEKLTLYPNHQCDSIRIALKDLLFSVCGLTIFSTIICTLSAVICCIQIFSLDVTHVLAPQRSTSVNLECFSAQDAILQRMMECEEFVPPVPPPPYYPPEYTCSSETDAQSITYNGSMDSPIPLYPVDFPPSYESVMGIREDSQATLYDAQANEVLCLSISDRIDSTGHSGNEDSSPSEDSVLLEMQGSAGSVGYVQYRFIKRSRADYCLSADCGQCGHHQQSPTISLQGPFEEVVVPRVKGGRSFSCSTPSDCPDPPSHAESGATRSCNRLETIGCTVGPCFPELRVKGKVSDGREVNRGSGCSLLHSSPCQTPDCPHRRYSENTRPKALSIDVTPRLVIRSHSDPGISSDFGVPDYSKVLEEDSVSTSSVDAGLYEGAGLHRLRPPGSPTLLRTNSDGKSRMHFTRKAVQRLSRSGALSLGDLKGGRNTRVLVARFLNRSRRSLKDGGDSCKPAPKSPLSFDYERRQAGTPMQSCGDLSSASSLRRLLSTSRRENRRPHSMNGTCKESPE
ncbi:protein FAM189B-like isoform X2 [Bufo bufo]|uniref:protein FAM189B-like isoform X2 n=2 Tax=Bufo bufo TaxID=8384 RepID=UPI001ABE3B0E|nr:protein FAM189B-like isoform X2 [Bufo bufo]